MWGLRRLGEAGTRQKKTAQDLWPRRRKKGGDAPQKCADQADFAYAEAIEQNAGRKLQRGVRPTVGAEQISEGDRCYAKGFVQRLLGYGNIDAVEVVHEHAEAQERSNQPAPARHGLVFRLFEVWVTSAQIGF